MKLSKYKIASIRESMTEENTVAIYLVRYHSRWSELSSEDFRYMWKTPSVTANSGYLAEGRKTSYYYTKRRTAC